MSVKTKTLRLSSEIIDLINKKALVSGISFNDMTELLLRKTLSLEQDPVHELTAHISTWLLSKYSQEVFPQDITHCVFLEIQANENWYTLYQKATDNLDLNKMGSVNRRLGLSIARILNAKVIGRSLPLNDDSLIKSYSFLTKK